MITIQDTSFTSHVSLADILQAMTKAEMLGIIGKLKLYVSPNLKKEETARRVARELLENPVAILSTLCKAELELVDEFIKAGVNTYVTRKMRKNEYRLQKYGLVLTHIDYDKGEWHLLMPDSVRESLAIDAPFYLDMAKQGKKGPTPKELRIAAALGYFYGL